MFVVNNRHTMACNHNVTSCKQKIRWANKRRFLKLVAKYLSSLPKGCDMLVA